MRRKPTSRVCREGRISIHAPLRGVRRRPGKALCTNKLFQSTHPCAGCDHVAPRVLVQQQHFNPRTPCGVRQSAKHSNTQSKVFQSTHPVRGATPSALSHYICMGISIHAPRAGCDMKCTRSTARARKISIHAPRAGCDLKHTDVLIRIIGISIHAPRAGCDCVAVIFFSGRHNYFNPRTPCGVRQTLSRSA